MCPPPNVVLPIGISFFTFTQIAYLVDVARREVSEPAYLRFGLFVSYFPHLLAGPIIHHKDIMPQFDKSSVYRLSTINIAVGLTIFVIGLFKKVALADSFVPSAALAFTGDHPPLLLEAWRSVLAYTLEIYFDFSGYSDMAIGLSRLFGIELPLNFNSPYKATSIIDFWRRWHMTLSKFLRDYLYYALGGNRKGKIRRYANLYITMLLGGICMVRAGLSDLGRPARRLSHHQTCLARAARRGNPGAGDSLYIPDVDFSGGGCCLGLLPCGQFLDCHVGAEGDGRAQQHARPVHGSRAEAALPRSPLACSLSSSFPTPRNCWRPSIRDSRPMGRNHPRPGTADANPPVDAGAGGGAGNHTVPGADTHEPCHRVHLLSILTSGAGRHMNKARVICWQCC